MHNYSVVFVAVLAAILIVLILNPGIDLEGIQRWRRARKQFQIAGLRKVLKELEFFARQELYGHEADEGHRFHLWSNTFYVKYIAGTSTQDETVVVQPPRNMVGFTLVVDDAQIAVHYASGRASDVIDQYCLVEKPLVDRFVEYVRGKYRAELSRIASSDPENNV